MQTALNCGLTSEMHSCLVTHLQHGYSTACRTSLSTNGGHMFGPGEVWGKRRQRCFKHSTSQVVYHSGVLGRLEVLVFFSLYLHLKFNCWWKATLSST